MRIRDPGWRQFGSNIRDGKKSDPGSGKNIPDPQHCVKVTPLQCCGTVVNDLLRFRFRLGKVSVPVPNLESHQDRI
jgi:hypothetical protein